MNLHRRLLEREAAGKPLRVGLIGAGKFGAMFLSQARRTLGLHVLGVADLAPDRAHETLTRVGWPETQIAAATLDAAAKGGATWVGEDAQALIAHPALDVVIDATGSPAAGIGHARWPRLLTPSISSWSMLRPTRWRGRCWRRRRGARVWSTASPMATSRR